MTPRSAYTSTVVAPGQILAGLVLAAILIAVLPGPLAWRLATGVVITASCGYLGTVRLAAGPSRIMLGQGPFAWPRWSIPAAMVTDAHAESLSWPQVFGFGVPWHRQTTRLTVRPGPTLVLRLSDGAHIRVSTPDPRAAAQVITWASPAGTPAGAARDIQPEETP